MRVEIMSAHHGQLKAQNGGATKHKHSLAYDVNRAAPSLVCVLWAALTAFGVDNRAVMVVVLLLLAVALCNSEAARIKRRKERCK